MSVHFEVIVPSFNALPWLTTCLDSIAAQTYRQYHVTVLDDASTTPGEAEFVRAYCEKQLWTSILQTENMRCPHNLRSMLGRGLGWAEDVVLVVDGDDWLAHDQVLAHLAEVYADPDVWLTWGSYTRWPNPAFMPNPAGPYPDEVTAARSFRAFDLYCPFNHPLAFRRFLFDAIPDAELQDEHGQWFTAGYDIAIMMPMMEMSAPDHCRFLPEVSYVYNEGNDISDAKIRPEDCDRVHRLIRSRPPLPRLRRS